MSSGSGENLILNFTGSAPNDTTSYFLVCSDTSANRMIVKSNGDIVNTNNSYGALSDVRLKENIEDARSYWDDFAELKYHTYNLKIGSPRMIGLIAQELSGVFPALVSTGRDGYLSVKSSVVHEIGMSVIIEAQGRIESLEERADRLETENTDLRAEVETLKAA